MIFSNWSTNYPFVVSIKQLACEVTFGGLADIKQSIDCQGDDIATVQPWVDYRLVRWVGGPIDLRAAATLDLRGLKVNPLCKTLNELKIGHSTPNVPIEVNTYSYP